MIDVARVTDAYPLQFTPPLVSFEQIDLATLNRCLVVWGHKMGPLNRTGEKDGCHALLHYGQPVAVTSTSSLINATAGGYTRDQAIELSRVCAVRRDLCRVALRLWREFVFPTTSHPIAISYQDADEHNGNLYRFDGWQRVAFSHSGTDTRSGRPGRDKWIWVYPPQRSA